MIWNSSWVMIGARPRLGSSHSSSFGRLISARAMASICCSPPDNVPAFCARRSRSRGNVSYHRAMSVVDVAIAAHVRAGAQVVVDGEIGERATALRHLGDAEAHDGIRWRSW